MKGNSTWHPNPKARVSWTRDFDKKGFLVSEYERFSSNAKLGKYDKYTFGDMLKICNVISRHAPIKNEDGDYSALETILAYRDDLDWSAALKIVTHLNRSHILAGSPTSNPEYARWSRYTPIPMHAFKDKYNIDYMQWSIEDDEAGVLLKYFMGKSFYSQGKTLLLNVIDTRKGCDIPTIEELKEFREGYYSQKSPNCISRAGGPLNMYDNAVKDMLLQLHTCQGHLRKLGVHILDPVNWDATPDSFDLIKIERPPLKHDDLL